MPTLEYKKTFDTNPKGLFLKLKAKKPDGNRELNYKALFDTGAEISGITQKVVDDLGLEKVKIVEMRDASGHIEMVSTFYIDIIIPTNPSVFIFNRVEVPLMRSTQGEDILLGMNILSQCSFSLKKEIDCYTLSLEIDTD